MSLAAGSIVFALLAPTQVFGRFVFMRRQGWLTPHDGIIPCLLIAAGVAALLAAPNLIALAAFVVLFGAGAGLLTPLRAALVVARIEPEHVAKQLGVYGLSRTWLVRSRPHFRPGFIFAPDMNWRCSRSLPCRSSQRCSSGTRARTSQVPFRTSVNVLRCSSSSLDPRQAAVQPRIAKHRSHTHPLYRGVRPSHACRMSARHRLERLQLVPAPRTEVFAFFSAAENLERLTPDFLNFQVLTASPIVMQEGALIEYQLKLGGLPMHWLTEIALWEPGERFIDIQRKGPYRSWEHLHEFRDVAGGTEMRDSVEYELPLGALGSVAHALFVRRTLERIFDFRARSVARLFISGASTGRDPRTFSG